jgi:TolB-like protein/Flp pilus assembly protein TadD
MQTLHPSRGTVRFDLFEVDFQAGELRKQGAKVKLQEQPFQILQALLEHPGEVVTREELQKRIWPADTFVDFEQGLYNAIKRLREALGDSPETPHYIETLPRRGYRFIGTFAISAARIESLAVLPLENLSGDPEQEYFADGMTEALITSLAKVGALRVISRTSAMRYKKSDKSLPQIAKELNVEAVVEGTVLRSGKRLRISAQLVQATTDTHLWAESYERDLRDVLALQDELARAIASEIQVKLTSRDHERFARAHPVHPEAYETYLKARYYWNKFIPEGIRRAVEYFQQAIAIDPSYAAAYTGLADCASRLGWLGFVSPDRGFAAAKAAAQKAVEMDPELAEAHGSLGWAIMHYDWDCNAAEKEFRRALELNPNYATVSHFLAPCLLAMGRSDDSIAEIKRVLRLDPLSLIVNMSAAAILFQTRRFDESIEYSRKALELDPNFASARWILGCAYERKGMHEPAIAELRKAIQLSDGHALYISALGHIYASAGRRDDALKILEQLKELSKQRYVMPNWMAQICACLNERDEAFRWLEKVYEDRSAWGVYTRCGDILLDNLRPDPRFQDLLRRMNFPA